MVRVLRIAFLDLARVLARTRRHRFELGLDLDLFTPMFALSRMSGWTGHCIEYLKDNKLIRPGAAYVGPHEVPYVAMDDR